MTLHCARPRSGEFDRGGKLNCSVAEFTHRFFPFWRVDSLSRTEFHLCRRMAHSKLMASKQERILSCFKIVFEGVINISLSAKHEKRLIEVENLSSRRGLGTLKGRAFERL